MEDEKIEWAPVFGASKYQISRCGKVRSVATKKFMALTKTPRGYIRLSLYFDDGKRKARTLHQLLALTFIPNPEGHKEIDHIDRNRGNNSIQNLRWVSRAEQAKNRSFNYKSTLRRRPVWQLTKDGVRIQRFGSAKEASRITQIGESNINNVASGWSRLTSAGNVSICETAGGYKWEYCDEASRVHENEIWREVPRDRYPNSKGTLVSDQGRLKRPNGHIIDLNRVQLHYVDVGIGGYYYKAHRLIADIFVPNDDPERKTICNHRDGNKWNNRADNVEWLTPSENSLHAHRSGLCPNTKKIEQLDPNGARIAIHNSITECAKTVGISDPTIRKLLKGKKSIVTTDVFRYVETQDTIEL